MPDKCMLREPPAVGEAKELFEQLRPGFAQPHRNSGSALADQLGWNRLEKVVHNRDNRKLADSFYPTVLKIRSPASPSPGTI